MTKDEIFKFIQNAVSAPPLILVGSGGSAPHGLPSMKELGDYLSMALIANVDVFSRLHIPQEYWKKLDVSEYNVPWGKTEIK